MKERFADVLMLNSGSFTQSTCLKLPTERPVVCFHKTLALKDYNVLKGNQANVFNVSPLNVQCNIIPKTPLF